MVVGAHAELSGRHSEDHRAGGYRVDVEEIEVRGPDPIDVRDLVVPGDVEK